MKKSRVWAWWAVATSGLAVASGGCAAEDPSLPPAPTTDGGGTSAGGASPSTTTATTGGAGGAGGQGGEDLGPCGTDCSTIDTPPCFVAVCNEGQAPGPIGSCVVVEDVDGTPCDDGTFCTVNDTCQAGVCTGGDANTCGLEPAACNEIVCDEDNQTCGEQPVQNGAPCDSGDLCLLGATCTNGICSGGAPESCFLEPVPNNCFVSVCNPANGQCEPIVGNDGQSCTDLNDLCTDQKFCNNGACVGGQPKDCSGAAAECEVGVCDMATGQCQGAPGTQGQACNGAADECNAGLCDANGMCQPDPLASGTACTSVVDECNAGECDGSGTCTAVPTPGASCASVVDQCNTGSCDASGTCQPVPVTDGTTCDDQQACTANDSCQSGVCTGTTTATCSLTADGCCPAACDATNDIDCACGIDDIIIEEVSTASPDFVLLKNTSTCPLDIDAITVCKDEGSTEACDDLPSFTLGPNEEVYLIESGGAPAPAPAQSLILSYFMSWEGSAGAIFICDGPCTNASAPNATDAVIWLTSTTVTLPPGINFSPGPVTGVNGTNDAVKRTAVTGSYPNFFASDWVAQPASYD